MENLYSMKNYKSQNKHLALVIPKFISSYSIIRLFLVYILLGLSNIAIEIEIGFDKS